MNLKINSKRPGRPLLYRSDGVQGMRISAVAAILIFGLAVLPARHLQAQDDYEPFVEPLQVLQKRYYEKAAPQGWDSPLSPATETVLHPGAAKIEPEESVLEKQAEEKIASPTLMSYQQNQALTSTLTQFGYNIFNQVPSTFAPVESIPVPPDYRIGAGDNIIVQLFGKRNVEYRLAVTRDGKVLIPEYGPLKVAGLTFDEVEALITNGFDKRVIGARAVVTMGDLRTIQVRLTGDVLQPGVYTLGGLSTLIDGLLATGGVRTTGSLRKIELIRSGRRISELDLYDLLLRGDVSDDTYLMHNDTIFVPSIGDIVTVGGEVQRPGIYELVGEVTLEEVIDMAGGLLPSASLLKSHIERIQGQSRILIDFRKTQTDSEMRSILETPVRSGDFLRVLPIHDSLQLAVQFDGHLKRPGAYQFHPGTRFSDIVSNVSALLPGADLDFALIKREQQGTLRTEVLYFEPAEAMRSPGGRSDPLLQARDRVFIFKLGSDRAEAVADIVRELDLQRSDRRPASNIDTFGAIRFTGRLPLAAGSALVDVVSLAGGLLPGTDLHYGLIARTAYPGREVILRSFSLQAAIASPETDMNTKILPGDRVYFFDDKIERSQLIDAELKRLRLQSNFGQQEMLVGILGEVLHPGTYPLEPKMRASDLLCAARNLSRKAYGLRAELSRFDHSLDGQSVVEHHSLESSQLLQLCEYKRSSRLAHEHGLADSKVQLLYKDDVINPILQPMDQLTFTEKQGWHEKTTVRLSGEVLHPGDYVINRGETLCQVLNRAGGLSNDAFAFGASFSRRSTLEMQKRTFDELHGQLDELMIELSLSHSARNEEKHSRDFGDKQDYLKAIRQLEWSEPDGRLIIDLEEIMTCKEKHDLVLEDGDHLDVPRRPEFVQVAGQVYVPTSHQYRKDRKIGDYLKLSGGHTVLGRLKDTYVIQPNGEVLNYSGRRSSSRITKKMVMPGAKIYVPLNVDRMNTTERLQSWTGSLIQAAILAGIAL